MSFVIEVASSPDRDEPVVEIWWHDEMVAAIRKSPSGQQFVDLYPSRTGKARSFVLEAWMDVLQRAKNVIG